MAVETQAAHPINPVDTLRERLDLSTPLLPERLAEAFPYLERDFSFTTTRTGDSPSKLVLEPQYGAMVSYGVFMYAMPEGISRLDFFPGRSTFRVPTKELLTPENVDPKLLEKGIVVAGSEYYKKLGEELSKLPQAKQGWGWVDEQIYRSHIIFEPRSGERLNHLIIPSTVNLDPKYIITLSKS